MTISRVRSHEGTGLTIRIPRHSDKTAPTSSQPLMSPTHPCSVLLSRTKDPSRAVGKSKSLATSMDKLNLSNGVYRASSTGSSSRESSFAGSRGSTPSRTLPKRSATPAKEVKDSKASPTPERGSPDKEVSDRVPKPPDSPTGSDVSLNSSPSVASSTHSVNSAKSSEASAKSSNTSAKSANVSCPSVVPSNSKSPPVRASSEPPTRGVMGKKRIPSKESLKPSSPHSSPSSSVSAIRMSSPRATPFENKKSSSSSSLSHSPLEEKRSDSSLQKPISRRSTPSRSTPPRSTTGNVGTQRKSLPVFNSYMSLFQVQERLKKGEVIEGVLRINPKNYEDALISAPVLLGRGDGHLYWRGT